MRHRRSPLFYAGFLAPATVIYAIFFIYPVLGTLYVSLYRWNGLESRMRWVGLGNFRQILLGDPVFPTALANNLYFAVLFPLVTLVLSLFLAAALRSRRSLWERFLESAYFFPAMISWVAIAVLWSFIYNPGMGILNQLLPAVGLGRYQRAWLGDPEVVRGAVLVPLIWRNVGFYMVMFLAAMKTIPKDFYDAATIDGATGFAAFRYITLPLIWEVISVAMVFMVINALMLFDAVWIMTEGGPARRTETIATYFYRKAFLEYQMGYATAIAVVLLAAVFVVTVLIRTAAARREVVQY